MSAYLDLNDVPATGNRWLLHDVLRDDWKFRGFVVSDANSVKSLQNHGYAKDVSEAALYAFNAGVNMEMAIGSTAFSKSLAAAFEKNQITMRQIEDAVRPILEMKIRLGLFEHPYVDEARAREILTTPGHRTAARLAAERTAVLLRNEAGLLPLKKDAYKKIAVLGPLADSQIDTLGSWAFQPNLPTRVAPVAGSVTMLGCPAVAGLIACCCWAIWMNPMSGTASTNPRPKTSAPDSVTRSAPAVRTPRGALTSARPRRACGNPSRYRRNSQR